jgi:hypothetical protein
MSLQYVTLTLDLYDGQGNAIIAGEALFTPTAQLTDTTNHELIVQSAVPAVFHSAGTPTVKLLATDNGPPAPAGWAWTVTFSGVAGNPASFNFLLPYASGASQNLSAQAPVSAPSSLLGSTAAGVSVYPSGDTTGATDQAAITAAEALARVVWFAPGTFYVTGLTKQANTIWQGAGRLATIIQLANGSNADVIIGANFSTLTLSGSSSGGIGGWAIRDLTIDGNSSHQSGTSHGLRVYGYNFNLRNVSIRNTLSSGLYTEWANFGGGSIPDGKMNALYEDVRIHDVSSHGWHNRGPHDSKVLGVTFSNVGSSSYGYWGESNNATTVAAGSNTVNVSTFAGSGTLNVATTLGYPTASISSTQGALSVATSGTTAVITYTGVTATSFTGCTTVSGSGTLSTGGTVTPAGQYSAAAMNIWGMHCSGNTPAWAYVLDTETHLTDCTAEPGSTGMFLIRGSGCQVTGGEGIIYAGISQVGLGIQLGDAANAVSGALIVSKVSGLSNAGASTCSLNITNDGGSNDVTLSVYAPSGSNTTVVSGTPSGVSRYQVHAAGATASVNAANSLVQDNGPTQITVPASATNAWRLTGGTTDLVNFNSTTPRISWPNGITHNWYSDSYSTLKAQLTGSTGALSVQSAALNSGKITGLGNGSAATDAAAYGQLPAPPLYIAPTGATAETFPRGNTSNILAALSSGILYVRLIPMQIGTVVNNITFITSTTAKTGGTHGWYVLLDSSLVVRAVTADQTDATTVWGTINTYYTLATTAQYTATYSGVYYVGVMVAESGGTMPTFAGAPGILSGVGGAAPILSGTSSVSQTTPPTTGTTMTTVSSSGNYQFYAYTS